MLDFVSLTVWMAAHAAVVSVDPLAPDLASVLQAPPATSPKWTGSVAAGGIVTTGNSDTRNGNASASAEYKREKDRVTLNFLWVYSDQKGSDHDYHVSDRKTVAKTQYDYFFEPKTYGLANLSMDADYQANVDLRTIAGVGIGHQFLDGAPWKFAGEAGLSYYIVDYDATFTTGDANQAYLAARLAYKAEWNPNKMWSLGQNTELFPSLEDVDDVSASVDTHAKATLTENMFAQFQWIFDWDNTPASGKERVDNRYLLSIGWKF